MAMTSEFGGNMMFRRGPAASMACHAQAQGGARRVLEVVLAPRPVLDPGFVGGRD
jgi:hypothetical protein